MQFHPGVGVGLGNDYTLYALKEGIVSFKQSKYINSVGINVMQKVYKGRKLPYMHANCCPALCIHLQIFLLV